MRDLDQADLQPDGTIRFSGARDHPARGMSSRASIARAQEEPSRQHRTILLGCLGGVHCRHRWRGEPRRCRALRFGAPCGPDGTITSTRPSLPRSGRPVQFARLASRVSANAARGVTPSRRRAHPNASAPLSKASRPTALGAPGHLGVATQASATAPLAQSLSDRPRSGGAAQAGAPCPRRGPPFHHSARALARKL